MFDVTGVGRLTADPELRFTPSGVPVAQFKLAANKRVFDKQKNDWVDGEAVFLWCEAWKHLAENIAGSFAKGQEMLVQGKLKQENWQTEGGENRSILKLTVEAAGPNLKFATAVPQRSDSQGGGGPQGNGFGEQQQQGYARGGFEQQPQQDPWNSQQPSTQADDEPPF